MGSGGLYFDGLIVDLDGVVRLAQWGVEVAEGEVVTSGPALAALLAEREGAGKTAFVIGSPWPKAELAESGQVRELISQ